MMSLPLFPLGQCVITPGAYDAFTATGETPDLYLARHLLGDWGELDAYDRRANDEALQQGLRLLSRYTLSDKTVIWIITEADRSVTTILLPEEY
jgi:hypothetical protein